MKAFKDRNQDFVALNSVIVPAILAALLINLNSSYLPASAGSSTGTTSSADGAAVNVSDKTNKSSIKQLSGEVQIINLDLDKLRDVGLDLKRVRHAAGDLYDEVTMQPVNIQTQPTVVGTNIIYVPIGFSPAGYMPPRKKSIDACMNEMRPIITVMQDDVNDFVSGQKQFDLSENTRAVLKPLFEQWAANVNEISAQLKILEPLTQGPHYNNKAIGNAAATIDKDSKQLETMRKKIYKQIQKEGREKKVKN